MRFGSSENIFQRSLEDFVVLNVVVLLVKNMMCSFSEYEV
jgi:hypothetical protein